LEWGATEEQPPDALESLLVQTVYYKLEGIMRLKVVLEPSDEGGYTAVVPALPGCISEGDTREETLKNVREAIDLYLEPIDDDLTFAPNAELLELTV
jgi:predicted RNase H-like HicB family nuclease